jgi:hypothetical protein
MIIADFFFSPYLEKGEKIIEVFHSHPFVMLVDVLRIGFFGGVIPVFLFYLFPELFIFCAIWLFLSFCRFMYVLIDWYHDVMLATNVSLIAVQWNGFFDRVATRLEYNQIDGTTSSIRGFRKTVFNYGDISVTHGSGLPLILVDAINPKRVEKKIMVYQDRFVSDQNFKDSNTLKTLLTTMIRQHVKTEGVSEKE